MISKEIRRAEHEFMNIHTSLPPNQCSTFGLVRDHTI